MLILNADISQLREEMLVQFKLEHHSVIGS